MQWLASDPGTCTTHSLQDDGCKWFAGTCELLGPVLCWVYLCASWICHWATACCQPSRHRPRGRRCWHQQLLTAVTQWKVSYMQGSTTTSTDQFTVNIYFLLMTSWPHSWQGRGETEECRRRFRKWRFGASSRARADRCRRDTDSVISWPPQYSSQLSFRSLNNLEYIYCYHYRLYNILQYSN